MSKVDYQSIRAVQLEARSLEKQIAAARKADATEAAVEVHTLVRSAATLLDLAEYLASGRKRP